MARVARGLVIGQAYFFAVTVFALHPQRCWSCVGSGAPAGERSGNRTLFPCADGFAALMVVFLLGDEVKRHEVRFSSSALTIGLSLAMGLLNYNFDAPYFWVSPAGRNICRLVQRRVQTHPLVGMSFPISYFAGLFPVALSRNILKTAMISVCWYAAPWNSGSLFVVPLVIGAYTFLAGPIITLSHWHRLCEFGRAFQDFALVGCAGCPSSLGVHGFASRHRPSGP